MKKILFLIISLLGLNGICSAQTANRNGFFLEAGIGGIVGSMPRISYGIIDNTLQYKCISGAAFDFGFGGRFRISRNWAYEIKGEINMPFVYPKYSTIFRFDPIGFRYTTPEIWRNISLFVHADTGLAFCKTNGKLSSSVYEDILNNMGEFERVERGGIHYESIGVAYSLGIGCNLTTHLYLEAFFNGQTLFNSYGKKPLRSTLNGGLSGVLIGYRF